MSGHLRHRRVVGPPFTCDARLAQELALPAPQPLDELLSQWRPLIGEDTEPLQIGARKGRQPLLSRAWPGQLRECPVEPGELEDMAAGEFESPLTQLWLPVRKSDLHLRLH
jgi:hypothetical protein